MIPSGPIQNVMRTIPRNDFPKKLFIRRASYGPMTSNSVSREQRKIQIVLGLEFRLRLHGISAAAHDCRIRRFELVHRFGEFHGFVRASGGIGLGIKIEDEILAAIIGERNGFAVVGGRR